MYIYIGILLVITIMYKNINTNEVFPISGFLLI
jgi:hypothetical protein